MSRARTKAELQRAAAENWDRLNAMIDALTGEELAAPFDFSGDEKKKEAHWGRDQNLRDVLIHLYEWHRLLLNWVRANQAGERAPFLPAPYNWKTYGDMNLAFWRRHQTTPLEDAKALLAQSHREVMALLERFSDEELFTKGTYQWVCGSTLGSYFISVTASHYDWAMKKLKAHCKNCKAR